MNNRYVIWVGCILIFIAGILWAKLPTFFSFDGLKDTVEVLSFIATIMVAIIAVTSLKTWREQWDYNSKQEALRRLHNALEELSYVEIYLKAYAWYRFALRVYPDTESAKQAKEIEEKAHVDLKQSTKDFVSSLQDVHLAVPDYPFVEFLVSSQKLHKRIIEITNDIDAAYRNVETPMDSVIAYAQLAGKALATEILAAKDQVFALRKQTHATR